MDNATSPIGVSRNGRQTNTQIQRQTAARVQPSSSPNMIHGLEDDTDLYDRVLSRVRSAGQTVPVEDVLGSLDECGTAGQPGSD